MNPNCWRRETRDCGGAAVMLTVVLISIAISFAGCGKKAGESSGPSRGAKREPAAKEPAANEPAAQEAIADKPAASEPSAPEPTASEPAAEGKPESGAALYAQHCAACHGEKGDGKGLAAKFLFPKPRDFRSGRFRLVSTSNGVPTFDDLRAVLRRGMPGSSMPPWPHLSDEAIKLLADHVMALRREGVKDTLMAAAAEADEELSAEELKEGIDRMTTPGEVVPAVDLGAPTPEAIAAGKELYATKGCAQCHGATGKGDGQQQMVDAEGLPTRPRDLVRGIFKGSPDPEAVWRRIKLGLPGTPMPSSQNLQPKEVADLTHFILSLSSEAARNAAVLTRERIVVKRVEKLPAAADAPEWQQVQAIPIRTAPLWWRDDAEPGLSVQAVHDGQAIRFRLTWADPSANLSSERFEDFEDAVAVQLFRGPSETFLGMGAPGGTVDMWFWDADRQSHEALEKIDPRIVVDWYPLSETAVASAEYDRAGTRTDAQPPLALPAVATGNQIVPTDKTRAASSLEAAGPGSLTFRPVTSQLVDASGQWVDGRWTVTMTRALQVGSPSDGLSLEPGAQTSVAFAVWDGGASDRDGKKLVSIWQDFELERENKSP